jgi:tetratricopeptide (TPR) repeat protein
MRIALTFLLFIRCCIDCISDETVFPMDPHKPSSLAMRYSPANLSKQQIVALSVRASLCLSVGSYQEAIQALTLILRGLLEKATCSEKDELVKMESQELDLQYLLLPAVSQPTSSSASSEDDGYAMFMRSLIVEDADTIFASRQSQCAYTAVILYQMGLAYHIMGFHSKRSDKYFQTAAVVYQRGIHMLQVSCPDEWSYGLLKMALFNNLGHVLLRLGEFERVRECMDRMVPLLTDYLDYFDEVDADLLGCRMNVLVLQGSFCNAPAA